MRSRLLAIGAPVVLFAALMGSCKSAHKNTSEVRVAYLQIIPSLRVFVAQEQRLFDRENLRLKVIVLGSSNDLVNTMVAGQADILPAVPLVPIIHLEIRSPGARAHLLAQPHERFQLPGQNYRSGLFSAAHH